MTQTYYLILICFSICARISNAQTNQFEGSKNNEGSSNLLDLQYHMGPILTSPINLYIIWYGNWNTNHQSTIQDFLYSLSSSNAPSPSVSEWWQTVRLYTDQTGSNVSQSISLMGEFTDSRYSHGKYLTRLSIQSIIQRSVTTKFNPLPLNYKNGLYLVLTSSDVGVQDFCRAVCGFHYFTFPSIVGVTVPYAWVGHSGTQCPGVCAYPFAWPKYSGMPRGNKDIMGPPNGDVGTDGMISVIAHELAEVSTNPLVNAWYAGDDPSAPDEIADLCVGVYGSGAGGGFVGQIFKDRMGNGYNLYGAKRRMFLVQWVWDPVRKSCFGPNDTS
ncbi:protein EXORDIUM-like 7 [Rutidosis leptorrhynchoides]|uniref:protein EXORDIUM-like 7 n=1 Tax=Rutidosis leptorrhynchoides TaxID=125765 RepID=UPI003A9902D8